MLRRVLKLTIMTGIAMVLTVYCIGGDGILGNLVHMVMVETFGDLRFIVPLFIFIIAAVYAKYIFVDDVEVSQTGDWRQSK